MIMEVESPEQVGYDRVRVNLAESSTRDRSLRDIGFDPAELGDLLLQYGDHRGSERLRALIAADGAGQLRPDDVLVTVGAAGALFLTALQLAENTFQPHGTLPNGKRPVAPFAADDIRIPIYVITYDILVNTEMVKPAEEPKTWQDLLNPRWKGKILSDDMRARLETAL